MKNEKIEKMINDLIEESRIHPPSLRNLMIDAASIIKELAEEKPHVIYVSGKNYES